MPPCKRRGPPRAKAKGKAKATRTASKAQPKAKGGAKKEAERMPTPSITKFRFQYLDCKNMDKLMPGNLYWDRVSVSVPCAEVWQKVLRDPRFSREIEGKAASSSSSSASGNAAPPLRRLLTFPEMAQGRHDGRPLFNELAAFVYESVSDECRRQWAATQYWRARVKCFALWLRGQEGSEAEAADAATEDLPDPAGMTRGCADPYYRHWQGCGGAEGVREEGDGGRDDEHYNSLRQSQRVAPTQVPFLNTLRMCYAEVSAPQGSLVLLRGQGKDNARYTLAEYAERPEDELDSWRLAEYDEPLSGYRVPVEGASGEAKQTRRVAYPWRRRKVRVLCEIPKEVLQARGSGSVKKQGSSSKVLLETDAAMLRAYAAKVASKGQRLSNHGGAAMKRPAAAAAATAAAVAGSAAAAVAAPSPPAAAAEEHAAAAAQREQDRKAALRQRLAAAAAAAAQPLIAKKPAAAQPLAPAAKKSFKSLYDLLERTHFPKGCRSSVSVTGFIPKNYLIFGLHRAPRGAPCPNKLELTAATQFAFGKLGDDTPVATRLRSPAAQYRELLEAVQRHLLEAGMQAAPRGGRAKGISDPLSGKFIPEGQVRFTSVMVAKNKRTYFHRDGNNRGASYQVVITDPDKVASGEFAGGNLLCWPNLSREEATRRTDEVHTFHQGRRDTRRKRREEQRCRRRELNPRNERWKGDKDDVNEAGEEEEAWSESESDEDFVLHERHVDISDVKLEEDIEDMEEQHGLDSTQVPAYEDDATVVECVNRYVSFVGRDVWHATQPWRAAASAEKQRANRYCITFFAVDLKDGDGAAYKRELRDELVGMGFRPHESDLATTASGRGRGRSSGLPGGGAGTENGGKAARAAKTMSAARATQARRKAKTLKAMKTAGPTKVAARGRPMKAKKA